MNASAWHTIEVWLISLVVTVAVLAGFGMFARWCATSPAVRRDKLDLLHVGMTAEEVTALLGEPRLTRHNEEGFLQWLYGAGMKRHVLVIEFNSEGKARSFSHGVPLPSGSSRKRR